MKTPTLTEQFRTVAQAVLDECKKSGLQFDGIAFYPQHYNPFAVYGDGAKHFYGASFDEILEQIAKQPSPDDIRAEKIATLKAELAKLEAGQ